MTTSEKDQRAVPASPSYRSRTADGRLVTPRALTWVVLVLALAGSVITSTILASKVLNGVCGLLSIATAVVLVRAHLAGGRAGRRRR